MRTADFMTLRQGLDGSVASWTARVSSEAASCIASGVAITDAEHVNVLLGGLSSAFTAIRSAIITNESLNKNKLTPELVMDTLKSGTKPF